MADTHPPDPDVNSLVNRLEEARRTSDELARQIRELTEMIERVRKDRGDRPPAD